MMWVFEWTKVSSYIFVAMSGLISTINNFIQKKLKETKLEEISVVEAARWLDDAKILADSKSSPGFSLRRHIHRGNIFGAFKKNNYFWYISKLADYQEIMSSSDLSKLLGLKSRTSIYRKIQAEHIPYKKNQNESIFFVKTDLMKWALDGKQTDLYKSISNWSDKI